MIDYKWRECKLVVKNDPGSSSVRCWACGIGACLKCTENAKKDIYIGGMCKDNITQLYKFPRQFLRKKAKKKLEKVEREREKQRREEAEAETYKAEAEVDETELVVIEEITTQTIITLRWMKCPLG